MRDGNLFLALAIPAAGAYAELHVADDVAVTGG